MTHSTDHRSAREIEADLERERAGLAETLDELQSRVSVDHLAREALGMLRSNAGSYARSIDGAVRANPVALAVTAAGLAWLMFGPSDAEAAARARRAVSRRMPRRSRPQSYDPAHRADPADRWPEAPPAPAPSFGDATAYDAPSAASASSYGTAAAGSYGSDRNGDHGWSHRIDRMRQDARDRLRRIESEARHRGDHMRGSAHHGYEGARDYAAERARVLRDFARNMQSGFTHGLEGLSEGARERIVAARERAYSARLRAERVMREGSDRARTAFSDYPLMAGALALAAGAAAGAALPRTRWEDETFGAESDRLMDEATRMMQAERARAERMARGVAEELREGARDVADRAKEAAMDAAQDAKDRASETAERARDRASEEAKKGGGSGAASSSSRKRESGIEDLPGRGPSSTVPGGDVAPAEEVPARPGFGPDVPGEDLPGDTVRGGDWGGKGGAGSAGASIGTSDTPKPGTTRGAKG